MTRQEQNTKILGAIQHQLQDKMNVQESIVETFSNWVRALIEVGQAQLAPQPVQPGVGQNGNTVQ